MRGRFFRRWYISITWKSSIGIWSRRIFSSTNLDMYLSQILVLRRLCLQTKRQIYQSLRKATRMTPLVINNQGKIALSGKRNTCHQRYSKGNILSLDHLQICGPSGVSYISFWPGHPLSMGHFDSEAKDIVENLLRLEPGERLGSRDTDRYTSIKSHEFFHGIHFDVLHKQDPPSFDPPVKKENLWSEDGEYLLPGFDPRVIAQRILSGDGDQPIVWANSSVTSGSKDQMELIKNPDPVEPISSEKIDQPEKSPSSRCYCCWCVMLNFIYAVT